MNPTEQEEGIAHRVIGAGIEVHRHLGPGFLEAAYEHALAIELAMRGIAFERQVTVPLVYKGTRISDARLDLLVGGVVFELKAVEAIHPIHVSQVLSYLHAANARLGCAAVTHQRAQARSSQRFVVHDQ